MVTSTHGATSASTKQPVIGLWRTTEGEGVIDLYACDDQICGRFYWLKEDSPYDVSRDTANRDPAKRDRPLCGLQFMGGFRIAGGGKYEEGWIYDPDSGATYSAQMKMNGADKLDLHGYVFTPVLGESRSWTRVASSPSCETEGK